MGLLRSWRAIRWLVFLLAITFDAYIFYLADPFTPRSFLASGVGALLLFLFLFEVAINFKGRRRIRAALDEHEVITYQVGRHLLALLRKIREHRTAWYLIWIPIYIAVAMTTLIAWLAWQYVHDPAGAASWLLAVQYAASGYLPLLFAIPFVLELVSEWASYQYVIITDTKSHEPKLLIHHGVFDYDLRTISLERTVTTHVHQSWWESMIAIGNVELRETAGGATGEQLTSLWRPRRFEKKVRGAIKGLRRRTSSDE